MSDKPAEPSTDDTPNGTPTYISVGTIRVRSAGANGSNREMFFTPTKNFSVDGSDRVSLQHRVHSHVGEKYIALLPAAGNSGCGILAPYDSKKGVRLSIDGEYAGLVEAAIKQFAVEIEIEAKSENDPRKDCKDMEWSLRAITIPAA